MRRSLIFDTTIRLVFDAALVLSLYILFAGHNQPGGGFVGGLVASAALALRFLAGGPAEVAETVRIPVRLLPALGLVLAVGTALVPLLLGAGPLDHEAWTWQIIGLGEVTFATATIFDSGVYLIVVGVTLLIVEALGVEALDADDGEAAP